MSKLNAFLKANPMIDDIDKISKTHKCIAEGKAMIWSMMVEERAVMGVW